MVDIENKKVVVTGNFDQEKLSRKLNTKLHKKIKDVENKRKNKEAEMVLKKDEESKIIEEMDSDEEKEMAKYMLFSDANPNACSIS